MNDRDAMRLAARRAALHASIRDGNAQAAARAAARLRLPGARLTAQEVTFARDTRAALGRALIAARLPRPAPPPAPVPELVAARGILWKRLAIALAVISALIFLVRGIAGCRPLRFLRPAPNDSERCGRLEVQLGLRGRQRFAAASQLAHAVLEAQEANRRAQTVARGAREQEQLLANVAGQMRRGALSHQRGYAQRVAAQQRVLDLLEVVEKASEGVDSPAVAGGWLSHDR